MGSVWCKPGEMRQDCSPKLNIQSLLSRFSTQVCPSKCRYPQSTCRPRNKPRPRSAVLSQGKRPVISSPLVQPVPPPRKKRKQLQDFSRSEETLYTQENISSPLRTSISLPTVYDPTTIIIRNGNEPKQPMEPIKEEVTTIDENEELYSEPDTSSDIYFLKKEENPLAFSENSKTIIEIKKEAIDKFLTPNKPINETFTVDNDKQEKKEVVQEIINKEKETIENKKVAENLQQKVCEGEKNTGNNDNNNAHDNKVNDQKDLESIKKWQDEMKTKWLQSILFEAEPINDKIDTPITTQTTNSVNSDTNSDNKSPKDFTEHKITTDSILDETAENSQNKINNNIEQHQHNNNSVYENVSISTKDNIPKLIVTQKSLTETFENLQTSQTNNEENIHNNRNLIYSNENLNSNSKNLINDIKEDCNKKDSLKLDVEEKHNSNKHSRHSSITDSLQEFETSIYDMLQQSAKDSNSDEDDSFVIINSNKKNINNTNNTQIETAQNC